MKAEIALTVLVLVSPMSALAHSCPKAEFEKHLKALTALTPALSVAEPEDSVLAAFFQALPPDFSCFDRLFGYSDTDGAAPLYSWPLLHDLFPRIATVVPQEAYARKLVGLSVGAKWEADQTGALQDAVRAVLDSNTRLFVGALGHLSADAERSVWSFLFGAPHPSNVPLSRDVVKRICNVSARSCKQSRQVYSRAVADERVH